MRSPGFGECIELFEQGAARFGEAIGPDNLLLNHQIIDRKYVGPIQYKHQQHLDRPTAHAFDGDKVLHDFFVGQDIEKRPVHPVLLRERGHALQVTYFLKRQARTPQISGRFGQQPGWVGVALGFGSFGKKQPEPPEDGIGSFPRNLLRHNAFE